MKGFLDVKELESYKKADIQKLARDLGVSDAGTIKEIAARCAAVEVDIPGEGELTEEEKATVAEAAAEQAGGVRVEVVTRYLDQQFNKIKEAGEVFTVDSDRAAVLLAEKVVKIKE